MAIKKLEKFDIGRDQTGFLTDYRDEVKSNENFIKIGDITTGMGTNEGFEDYIQYYDLMFSFDKPMNPDAHGKLYSSGTVSMTHVHLVTANHHNIPVIYQKLWTGDKIDAIETQRTENTEGGTLRLIEKMTFSECYFTRATYIGDKFDCEFRALKFEIEKTPTKQTGEQEGVVPSGFDLSTNKLLGG